MQIPYYTALAEAENIKKTRKSEPDVEKINIMLDRINRSRSVYFNLNIKEQKIKENRLNRIKEVYDYFISI